ncbi:MAG TPA: hypothetical protein VF212_01580 [Longimicrobiales bacterium]
MKWIPIALLAFLAAPGAAAAQVPPDADWRTLETEHFRVTFPAGLAALASHAADRAEAAHARLSAEFEAAPRGKIDILLTDFVDVSNGSATPFPSNRIILYARPPVDVPELAYFDDWIDLVVTHELTHVYHLDATGGLGSVLRAIFGRVPVGWPFFPAAGAPGWAVEGLATYIESAHTGAGRVNGSYHEMVLRTAVLEDAFDPIDRVTGHDPRWPGASRAYIYGSKFTAYLAEEHGPEVPKDLVERTAGAWSPPSLAYDRVAKGVIGRSFTDAYDAWRAGLEARYGRLADSLRAEGLTEPERLTGAGYVVEGPRVGPDGRVAYAAYDGRSSPATRVLDPETGRVWELARRNGLDAVGWLPDGSILTAQLERDGAYRLYGDLYRVAPDGRERRLTWGARLTNPDVARDGRRVVAVQAADGTNRLAVYDLATGETVGLTRAAPGEHWAYPRWAPSGGWIAAARWRNGLYDVVVLDAEGRVVRELTRDRAVDAMPTWSPDGRYVLFSSDRSGIPNLYAYDLAAGVPASDRLRQVTNLLTGAFDPEVSPDGRWIYFSGYHADGFHVERIPFDPARWRAPAPLRPELRVAERAAPVGGAAVPDAATAGDTVASRRGAAPHAPVDAARAKAANGADAGATGGVAARRYSPLPTLLPRAWLPEAFDEGGLFLGAAVAGRDLVGRHAYALSAAYQHRHRLVDAELAYTYAGLGNPILGLEVWREWEDLLNAQLVDAPDAALMRREDGVALSATLIRRRARSSAFIAAGGEHVIDSRRLLDAPGYTLGYPGTSLAGAFLQAGYANYQVHPFSISREDGVSIVASARRRWDLEPVAVDGRVLDGSYDEAEVDASAYLSVPGPGFAHHVLAVRLRGRRRAGPGANAFGIGGASGDEIQLLGRRVAGESRDLSVRGFRDGARIGTHAWTASLEYRVPLALIGRGYRLWPFFLDRVSAAAFVDAGDAWCPAAVAETPLSACNGPGQAAIVGAGAELAVDLELGYGLGMRVRAGIGHPLRGAGPDPEPVAYIQFGPSF